MLPFRIEKGQGYRCGFVFNKLQIIKVLSQKFFPFFGRSFRADISGDFEPAGRVPVSGSDGFR